LHIAFELLKLDLELFGKIHLPHHTMSFLNELKNQAHQLREQQAGIQQDLAGVTKLTEAVCANAWRYLQDLSAQLNVIKPLAPGRYSLDGKSSFPQLQMLNFRSDARKKMHRSQEMFDYIGMGWDLLPATGQVATHSVAVNFPPDLERVTKRLSIGQINHERKEQRHPDTNKLQAYIFEYQTHIRGSVVITPDQDTGQIALRIANVGGFEVLNLTYPASQLTTLVLDELAKKLVGQPNTFA
jgi:hypothetical protein